jgi:hypothetical protein
LVGDKGRLVEHVITTLPPQGTPDPEAAAYIRRRSLELGKPREEVEKAIAAKIGGDLAFDDLEKATGRATIGMDKEDDLPLYGEKRTTEDT